MKRPYFHTVDECNCETDDCEIFGMACDECDSIGWRESSGWTLMNDGRTLCEGCYNKDI